MAYSWYMQQLKNMKTISTVSETWHMSLQHHVEWERTRYILLFDG